jgi:tRNA A-37 threonylcarbamoyl transferase component Bud32
VASRQWESLAGSATLFTHHRGNNVWRAEVPPFGKVVVKESRLDSSFPLFERLGRELRFRLFDVNMRDARAALAAERLGVATYHPLAVWRVRDKGWTACYIMYTYVEGRLLNDICKGGAFDEADRPAVKQHLRKLGQMARRLHDGGLRHRDLHPQNIVIRPDGSLALIDFASGYPVHCKCPRYRRTQDFVSLRRLARLFDADCLAAFAEGYAGTDKGRDYDHALLLMLYWKYNGLKGNGGLHRLSFWRYTRTAYDID